MEQLLQILREGNFSCVIRRAGAVRTFGRGGIIDLYTLLQEEPEWLRGAEVADKIVGKAAAALMVAGGVKAVATGIISRPALALLREASIPVDFGQEVDHIVNRAGTDWCPMERLCAPAADAAGCLPLIEAFIESHKTMPAGR